MTHFGKLALTAAAVCLASGGALAEGYGTMQDNNMNTPTQGQIQQETQAQAGLNASQIQDVQSSLRDEGYSVSVDGVWGPQTADAVRLFQREQNLSVTGTLNSETLAALDVDAISSR